MNYQLWNEDCITGAEAIAGDSVDLIICDPPFGIKETKFDQLYARNDKNIIKGYVEAPSDYAAFSLAWMTQAKRVLKPHGTLYVVVGHTPLLDVMIAARTLKFNLVNHIIWKYNFGASTTTKFVTSHYHILYLTKHKTKYCFNSYARFGPQEKLSNGGSAHYADLEDVFVINKEYMPTTKGETKKNVNKLPNALIRKLIQYSSNPGDLVCDFFMGNFTTAYEALALGREVIGFEQNPESFNYHLPKLADVVFGASIPSPPTVERRWKKGKHYEDGEQKAIYLDFIELTSIQKKTKKEAVAILEEKYQRGKFGLNRVLSNYKPVAVQLEWLNFPISFGG